MSARYAFFSFFLRNLEILEKSILVSFVGGEVGGGFRVTKRSASAVQTVKNKEKRKKKKELIITMRNLDRTEQCKVRRQFQTAVHEPE